MERVSSNPLISVIVPIYKVEDYLRKCVDSITSQTYKNLEIIFDCDPTIPCLLEGDEQQIRRVLNNIISNAIKFTSEGGVTVCVSHRPEEYG